MVYGRSLWVHFLQSNFDLIEVVLLCLKINKYTLVAMIIFLRLIQYLFQFATYKNLTHTKFLQILLRFHRTKPFIDSCSRSRVRRSNASALFFNHPLSFALRLLVIHTFDKRGNLTLPCQTDFIIC